MYIYKIIYYYFNNKNSCKKCDNLTINSCALCSECHYMCIECNNNTNPFDNIL